MSGSSLEAAKSAKKAGGGFICRRGSAHIEWQAEVLRDEEARWKFSATVPSQRQIDRELQEYELADAIMVPSQWAASTYADRGISPAKLIGVPLGVDVDVFTPVESRRPSHFQVLFAGQFNLRKGVPYLLEAFSALKHPSKRLVVAGVVDRRLVRHLARLGLDIENVQFLGPLSRPALVAQMQQSSVLVLPSVEDGFGQVVTQAMACAVPVVVSPATGARDVIDDQRSGFILPQLSSSALNETLQYLADNPSAAKDMGRTARASMEALGGWADYEDRVVNEIVRLVDATKSHGI